MMVGITEGSWALYENSGPGTLVTLQLPILG